ncbi:2-polyprenyl-3-methyl-5-hydroxy-6-metoxy-1,4-benzoquinol methylase [Thioalkalivibrio denitrificans]|uniref:2-polyprenyl-3-methyl-5-hydroxy-6-metoxy-1, 4-benzoquinol methylase n=1 Tax=Thioalkalivibrio denitrificans TaxID=108003 RepID=A0A1V3NFX8_9GAMM|nr:class I SAM-dependent methyltransferase [Thioalkalivibrio denitrificans]OOG23686.1 2-polyprenyl-3-methyl-5-hydroxy-6-metoxy-1,4-benzoquinol methylase [Thioalkalivibrio denitrificans]
MTAEAPVHTDPVRCTLCAGRTVGHAADLRRSYLRCDHCGLIFAHPSSHPDRDTEKAIYDLHENHPGDPGYRAFLSRLVMPLLERLSPGMEGLDYGCGPGPVLSMMLEEAGMRVTCFDPLYAPDDSVLSRRYDFVTCTEVVEHFHRPAEDWSRLAALLRPGGWLGVMTRMVPEDRTFGDWHYKNDPTHVSFYSPKVMRWLAAALDLQLVRLQGDVVLMRKPA